MQYSEFTVPSAAQTTTVATSTASAPSVALDGSTVYILCSAQTFVVRGTNPTATTACMPIPANFPAAIKGIQPCETLAFILGSGTGTVWITQGV